MTPKSTLIVAVTAAAGAGLAAAVWWSFFQPDAGVTLADYSPNEPIVRKTSRATQATRTSLSGPAFTGQFWPNDKTAGVTNPNGMNSVQKPPRPTAALPWGDSSSIKRPVEQRTLSVAAAPPLPATSMVNTATVLKFSPTVIAWLGEWEKNMRAGNPSRSGDMAQFERLLAEETTTVEQLIALMRETQTLEARQRERDVDPYPPVTGAVACRAVLLGAEQATRDTRSRYLLMSRVSPLIKRLWYGPERDLRATQAFYAFLAQTSSQGSPDWLRGHVATVELLMKRGRFEEALSANNTLLDDARLSPADQLPSRWLQGSILHAAGRYAEAVPYLELVADADEYDHSIDALGILVSSLSHIGRIDEARSRHAAYVQRRPGTASAASLAIEIFVASSSK